MTRRPVVELFEFAPCGVSIAWSQPAAAPAFVRRRGCVDPNRLWLNGQDTGFTITHLDQEPRAFIASL